MAPDAPNEGSMLGIVGVLGADIEEKVDLVAATVLADAVGGTLDNLDTRRGYINLVAATCETNPENRPAERKNARKWYVEVDSCNPLEA